MTDPAVATALITGIFAVITTWLTIRYKDKVFKKAAKPRDRMDTIFDGYEKLIIQQQSEIERKGVVIQSLENAVDRLEQELTRTRALLDEARIELKESKSQNSKLRHQLDSMRRDYEKTRK